VLVRIDKAAEEPLYLQVSTQIIAAIAREEIAPGEALPSVRSLAGDLGINLHTVNKAYAVLRDEGYIMMRGRSGAIIADPTGETPTQKNKEANLVMEEALHRLALAHRARGGSAREFTASAKEAAQKAYGEDD
jgi:DNA-binding transcriptional regulator YhcF (GntR family)